MSDRPSVRGNAQHWDPDRYARNARFVADLGAPLIDLLAPRQGESILDLGCGDGALTEKIASTGAIVTGVDASAEQVAAARARGLNALVMDGEALAFDADFDAVFSNAALHWMRRPDAVIDGMWRALRPGGRIIGEMGGQGNVATIVDAVINALDRRGIDGSAMMPWYFPSVAEYRRRLERAGFRVRDITLIPRPTPLPGDIADWLETFGEVFLSAVAVGDRLGFVDEVRASLHPRLVDRKGVWVADYVRLRFHAIRPS